MWYLRSEELVQYRIRQVFSQLDVNGSGKLEMHELDLLLRQLGQKLAQEDLRECFMEMARESVCLEDGSGGYLEDQPAAPAQQKGIHFRTMTGDLSSNHSEGASPRPDNGACRGPVKDAWAERPEQ